MKVTTSITLTHNPCGEADWASGLRENLTSRSYGEGLETGRIPIQAPRQSLTRQEFYKILKSGCQVEACRLQPAQRLQRYIALCTVIAWRLYWLTHSNRTTPTAPATTILSPEQCR